MAGGGSRWGRSTSFVVGIHSLASFPVPEIPECEETKAREDDEEDGASNDVFRVEAAFGNSYSRQTANEQESTDSGPKARILVPLHFFLPG